MGFGLRVGVLLFLLVAGTLSQDGFDLSDAIDDDLTTTAKPKEVPKASEKPKTDGGDDFGLDLGDAVGPDPTTPAKPKEVPKVPEKPKTDGGDGFDLGDALGPGPDPKPDKPAVNPGGGGGGGGGGGFDDLDLVDGKLDPDSGHGGGPDPGYNQDGADQPQEAGSGKIAGIVSAIGVALLGAASSYFAYQKKKLCFKIQGGQDPESGKVQHGQQNDPQVFSNLLRTS
ncbi:CD99 molecule isoform X1 [Sebastes fasciatus]|uniref:CD99 molecule isoform X1 n=1 Tax=Sebastes fasciatus TaxID=394691 RepID=UPI003D9FA728